MALLCPKPSVWFPFYSKEPMGFDPHAHISDLPSCRSAIAHSEPATSPPSAPPNGPGPLSPLGRCSFCTCCPPQHDLCLVSTWLLLSLPFSLYSNVTFSTRLSQDTLTRSCPFPWTLLIPFPASFFSLIPLLKD